MPTDSGKYEVEISRGLRRYVLVNFALAVAATFVLMLWSNRLSGPLLLICAVLVLSTVATAGGLMEARRWARSVEAVRIAAVVVVGLWLVLSRS